MSVLSIASSRNRAIQATCANAVRRSSVSSFCSRVVKAARIVSFVWPLTAMEKGRYDVPDIETIKRALVAGFEEGLGITVAPGEISEGEEQLARRYFEEEIGTDDYVAEIDNPAADANVLAGSHTGAGGTVDAFIKLEGPSQQRLQRVLLSGDFFVTPPRTVFDLEAHLQGLTLDELMPAIGEFFANSEIDMLSVTPDDFYASITSAIEAGAGHA